MIDSAIAIMNAARRGQSCDICLYTSCTGSGIFGVEMFVKEGGDLLLNEVAPRPHNSGHYTIEACHVSQFEQHLRAILGMSLGDPALKVGSR